MNEAFHAVSAILLHLVSDVSIDVQREGCRGVAQVALHSFDIVSCLQCRYSVGMSHIVEPDIRRTDLGNDLFEVVVNRVWIQIASKLVGKDQVHRVLETLSVLKLPGHLLLFHAIQNIHDLPRRFQLSGFAVLGGHQDTLSITLARPLELLVDQNGSAGKIHNVPSEPKDLALSHPGEQRNEKQILKLVSADRLQKISDSRRTPDSIPSHRASRV